jgi:hypothetical protein
MMTFQQNAPFFVDREIIVLTRNGIWLADDTEISHEPTAKLFARSLKKDNQGYYLHIGRETKRIKVEDTAYFVTRIDGDPRKNVTLSLNDQTQETLNPLTLKYRPGRLTCRIKEGQEEARFLHRSYFDLLKDLQEDEKSYYLEFPTSGTTSRIDLAAKL